MDDYYDYYLARPPANYGKSLDFYPEIDEPEIYQGSQLQGTQSLSAITETEKESIASSQTSNQREMERLDSFALEPEEVQKRFLTFLRERNKDIEMIELEDRIAKDLDIDVSDDEIRRIIGELNFKNKELRESRIRNKDIFPYDVERLKQEVLSLKNQNNYDKAVIKILRIKLRKQGKGTLGRTENLATKEAEKDKLLGRLQSVYDENIRLRQELQVQEQEYKIKIGKLNALNSELTKQLNSKFPALPEKDASKSDYAAHAAALRLKVRALNDEVSDLKLKIQGLEADSMKFRRLAEDREPSKFEAQIEQLKKENERLLMEREKIIDDLKLDKQLKLLFPHTDKLALSTLNVVHQVEQNKFIKQSYSKVAGGLLGFADKAFKHITPTFEKMGGKLMFFMTGQIKYHPESKKVIEATINTWNNASYVGKQVKMQSDEIRVLEDRIKLLEGELGHVGKANRPFSLMQDDEKKVPGHQQNYSIKELDNLKQQWENLPVFVKRYIKQLEGDVIRLKTKKGRKKLAAEEGKEILKPIKEKKEKLGKTEDTEKIGETKLKETKNKTFQGTHMPPIKKEEHKKSLK